MSKESKPRDRWSQLYSSAHVRPPDHCPGCGYYHVVNHAHRADCTAAPT